MDNVRSSVTVSNYVHPWLPLRTSRFGEAKLSDILHTCVCGTFHECSVYEDGTIFCDDTENFFVATPDNAKLFKMRQDFEQSVLRLLRSVDIST